MTPQAEKQAHNSLSCKILCCHLNIFLSNPKPLYTQSDSEEMIKEYSYHEVEKDLSENDSDYSSTGMLTKLVVIIRFVTAIYMFQPETLQKSPVIHEEQ